MERDMRKTMMAFGAGAVAGISIGALMWRRRLSEARVTLLRACEGDIIPIPRANRKILAGKVVRAFYGDPRNLWHGGRGKDVTSKVQHLLSSGASLVADNEIFGDPVPGHAKVLVIEVRGDVVNLAADDVQEEEEEADENKPRSTHKMDMHKVPARPVHYVVRPDSDPRIDQAIYVRYDPAEDRKTGAIIIVIPGGNYDVSSIDGHEAQRAAQWLVQYGITAVVLQYRCVSHGHYWPAQFEDWSDCARAVKRDAASWGCDAARIGVIGFSAGGHLAAFAALRADPEIRPKLQLLIYPAIDTLSPREDGAMDCWYAAKGHPPIKDSIHLQDCSQAPPAFLAGISVDRITPPKENTDVYSKILGEHGIPCEYVLDESKETDHGCGCEDWWTEPCVAWLESHGWALPLEKSAET